MVKNNGKKQMHSSGIPIEKIQKVYDIGILKVFLEESPLSEEWSKEWKEYKDRMQELAQSDNLGFSSIPKS